MSELSNSGEDEVVEVQSDGEPDATGTQTDNTADDTAKAGTPSQGKPVKQSSTYGFGIPSYSVEAAVGELSKIVRTGGEEGPIDALASALGNTVSSSTFSKKAGALRTLGLIATTGSTYSLTSLAKRIVSPNSEEDKATAIAGILDANSNLKKVYDHFKTKILPGDEYLPNNLVQLGFPRELAGEWAAYFRAAAKYANLLWEKEAGTFVVRSAPPKGKGPSTGNAVQPSGEGGKSNTGGTGQSQNNTVVQTDTSGGALPSFTVTDFLNLLRQISQGGVMMVPEISGGRPVVFVIPNKLSREDVAVLGGMLDGLKLMLPGLLSQDEKQQGERAEPT